MSRGLVLGIPNYFSINQSKLKNTHDFLIVKHYFWRCLTVYPSNATNIDAYTSHAHIYVCEIEFISRRVWLTNLKRPLNPYAAGG